MSAVTTLQDTIAGAAEKVGPSVVGLGRGWGHGSGVVIADGQVLTSAHNLRREETTVTFADGRREPGAVAGVDSDLDLAVLAVDTGDVPPVRWEPATGADTAAGGAGADAPAALGIGAPVIALATPAGAGCAPRSASSPPAGAASAARGGAGFVAPSSTPRRFRAVPRAGRWWTPAGTCSASTAFGSMAG